MINPVFDNYDSHTKNTIAIITCENKSIDKKFTVDDEIILKYVS